MKRSSWSWQKEYENQHGKLPGSLEIVERPLNEVTPIDVGIAVASASPEPRLEPRRGPDIDRLADDGCPHIDRDMIEVATNRYVNRKTAAVLGLIKSEGA